MPRVTSVARKTQTLQSHSKPRRKAPRTGPPTKPKPKLRVLKKTKEKPKRPHGGGWFRPWSEDHHPDFHVYQRGSVGGYLVRMHWKGKKIEESFTVKEFGSRSNARFAAVEFARDAVNQLKGYKPRGWRLGIKRAGNVRIDEPRRRVVAKLRYNNELFAKTFNYEGHTGRTLEQAEDMAREYLEDCRQELLRREKNGELGYDWFAE